jgi:hypothetical protein
MAAQCIIEDDFKHLQIAQNDTLFRPLIGHSVFIVNTKSLNSVSWESLNQKMQKMKDKTFIKAHSMQRGATASTQATHAYFLHLAT